MNDTTKTADIFNAENSATVKKKRPRPNNLRKKDKELRRKHKLKAKCRSGTDIKKNIRHKQPIEFQVKGQLPIKYCREIPLTTEVKKLLGRGVFKIIPEAIKQPGFVPHLVIYRDTQNNELILKAQLIERQERIEQDETGKFRFVPDTDFKLL